MRYLGYANECGEALAAFLPAGGVPASYALAISYVLADTVDKANKEYKALENAGEGTARMARVASSAVDALTWQLLASVFVPGSVIHLVVALTTAGLEVLPGAQGTAAAVASALPEPLLAAAGDDPAAAVLAAIPTAIGLGTIPFIVEPIDETIHKVCDLSTRPGLKAGVESLEGAEMKIDMGAFATGTAALGIALAFPPTLFSVSGVIEKLN